MAPKSYKLLAEYVILEKLKDEVEIVPATQQEVSQFVQKHYLHQFPTGTKKIYAVLHKQQDGTKPMVGCIIYGVPFHTVGKFLQPVGVAPNEILELKRLFIDDIGLRNIESFVIGQTIKLLKKDMPEIKVVITFADDKVGHVGSIYQATNAIYLGKSTDGKHKYLYIMHDEDKNVIGQVLKPQAYPKKEVPPVVEKMIKLKNILTEIKNDIHHTVAGFPEKSSDEDEQGPENISKEKHFTTTEPSKPTVHTKPGEHLHQYTGQHNLSVTPQSAKETGTPYYIGQDYVNILRQVYNKALFKTKSQYAAERALQSAMKSDYYKDSILKKYHDRIEADRARIGRDKAEEESEKIKKAVEDAEKKVVYVIKRQHQQKQDDGNGDEYPWGDLYGDDALLSHLAYRAGLGTVEYIKRHGVPRKATLPNFEERLSHAAYEAGMGTEDYLTRNGHHV